MELSNVLINFLCEIIVKKFIKQEYYANKNILMD